MIKYKILFEKDLLFMKSNSDNIIILGCQRAGKTTLTKKLCEKSKYTIFSVDALVYALENSMPETNIQLSTPIPEKSKRFVPFLASYFKSFKRNYPNEKYIIESCQILPNDLLSEPFFKGYNIVCLGYPHATIDEIFNNIRKSDQFIKNPYSAQLSDELLTSRIKTWISYSQILEEQCKKLNINFFETNINRNNVLNNIVDCIENEYEK